MKYFLAFLLFFTLSLAGIFGYPYGRQFYFQWREKKQGKEFKWGVGMIPYPALSANLDNEAKTVIKTAKELGVGYFRIEFNKQGGSLGYLDSFIQSAEAEGLKPVMIFQPNPDFESLKNPYQEGYQTATEIAGHYATVKYFQLANEPAAGTLKPTWSGINRDSYQMDKYQAVSQWLKGASAAIKSINPQAKIIITGNWLQFEFFKMLITDKVNFDIIGWDWFREEGADINRVTDSGETFSVIDKIAAIKPEIWIMEYGTSGKNQEKQKAFVEKFINDIRSKPAVKGAFYLILYDQVDSIGRDGEFDGLVGIVKNADGKYSLGKPKPAYYGLQKIIKDKRYAQ